MAASSLDIRDRMIVRSTNSYTNYCLYYCVYSPLIAIATAHSNAKDNIYSVSIFFL